MITKEEFNDASINDKVVTENVTKNVIRVENEKTRVEIEKTRVETEKTRVENEKTRAEILKLLKHYPMMTMRQIRQFISIIHIFLSVILRE